MTVIAHRAGESTQRRAGIARVQPASQVMHRRTALFYQHLTQGQLIAFGTWLDPDRWYLIERWPRWA